MSPSVGGFRLSGSPRLRFQFPMEKEFVSPPDINQLLQPFVAEQAFDQRTDLGLGDCRRRSLWTDKGQRCRLG